MFRFKSRPDGPRGSPFCADHDIVSRLVPKVIAHRSCFSIFLPVGLQFPFLGIYEEETTYKNNKICKWQSELLCTYSVLVGIKKFFDLTLNCVGQTWTSPSFIYIIPIDIGLIYFPSVNNRRTLFFEIALNLSSTGPIWDIYFPSVNSALLDKGMRSFLNCKYFIDGKSIYISTYIAPLQGNYSEALPAQARPKRRVLKNL